MTRRAAGTTILSPPSPERQEWTRKSKGVRPADPINSAFQTQALAAGQACKAGGTLRQLSVGPRPTSRSQAAGPDLRSTETTTARSPRRSIRPLPCNFPGCGWPADRTDGLRNDGRPARPTARPARDQFRRALARAASAVRSSAWQTRHAVRRNDERTLRTAPRTPPSPARRDGGVELGAYLLPVRPLIRGASSVGGTP